MVLHGCLCAVLCATWAWFGLVHKLNTGCSACAYQLPEAEGGSSHHHVDWVTVTVFDDMLTKNPQCSIVPPGYFSKDVNQVSKHLLLRPAVLLTICAIYWMFCTLTHKYSLDMMTLGQEKVCSRRYHGYSSYHSTQCKTMLMALQPI